MKFILFFLFLAFNSHHINAQTFMFENYTEKDGMAQDFIYTINQDSHGYLWIGTGDGLCRFDGKEFTTFTTNDSLSENVITASYEQPNGINWFGHMQGGITKFENGKFQKIKGETEINSQVVTIYGINNQVYFVTQNDGLFLIEHDEIIFIGKFGLEIITSLFIIDESNIFIGASNGLSHIVKDKVWEEKKRYLTEASINSISGLRTENVFIVGLESGGISKVQLKNGQLEFQRWDHNKGFENMIIKSVFEDKQGSLWLLTEGNGVIKIDIDENNMSEFTKYNEETGLKSNYIHCLFEDFESNMWFGSFGSGLSKLTTDFFTFYEKDSMNVYAYLRHNKTQWIGIEKGYIERETNLIDSKKLYDARNGFVNDKVISFYKSDNKLWIGTYQNGLYVQDLTSKNINKINWPYSSLHHRVNQLIVVDDIVYAATNGGLVIYNSKFKTHKLLTTKDGLDHNAIKSIHLSHDNKIYLGMRSQNLYTLENNKIVEMRIVENGEIEIIDITEKGNGNLLLATSENGIFEITNDQVIRYTNEDGLKSNYTYAIDIDANQNIWIGHRNGLSKINTTDSTINLFDNNLGISGQVNFGAMYLDTKNNLWIGTDAGLIKYDPSKEKPNNIGPKVNLLNVLVNDKPYDVTETIELPYGNYRIEFEYIGISFKNPEHVNYRFILEGHDGEYSNLSKENRAMYGKLSDGEYDFKVKAFNKDKFSNEVITLIKIVIAPPFWKRWWFFVLCTIGIISAVWLFDRIRSKRLRRQKQKLQEQLTIKTKEVVEKADKIEEINKDITASITYAERIQSALLPTKDYLTQYLPGSFVYFLPRDVVSGDFYFVRKFENKLIIACVDCTGHGVPGAFMSMIGSVTLRNIYKSMEATKIWLTPEQVLEKLDIEIKTILKQKEQEQDASDFYRSSDGMDLCISEINLDTKEVLISSAKRHYVIKKDGEFVTHGGDKRSIGGDYEIFHNFTLNRFHLNKNDTLYLFTDGFPDQFGGEKGKKLKVSGVKSMILEMESNKNINKEQFVKNHFETWKSDIFQIDDVLFMGIEF